MSEEMKVQIIGRVENRVKEPEGPEAFSGITSVIRVLPEYAEGLYRIEENEYLDILFYFHRSQGYQLRTKVYSGETKGVFASRSPHRPTGIGVTTVKLEKRDGNSLLVKGLDAIDGTPVLDIKPAVNYFSAEEKEIIRGKGKIGKG